MIIILLLSYSSSYAEVLQIINSGSATVTNYTISDFYLMAEGLTGTGQALEGTNVDVKMANNYEWAVVSYFSNSAYGTGGTGGNLDNGGSTNGNITGVYNWGKTYTFTAGIIDSYASKTLTTAGNLTSDSTRNILLEKIGSNRIDKFMGTGDSDYSIAKSGWYSWINWCGSNENYPYSARKGLFGFVGGVSGRGEYPSGTSNAATFRPVFYAQ